MGEVDPHLPASYYPMRVLVPFFSGLLLLDAAFLTYARWHRYEVFSEVRNVLQPSPPATLDELRVALGSLTREEHHYQATLPEGTKGANFIFSRMSKLHVWVEYEVETGRVRDAGLMYFASEPVDLTTGDGLGGKLDQNWPLLLIVGILLAQSVVWYRYYHRWPRAIRLVGSISVSGELLILYVSFAVVTSGILL